MQYAAGKGIQIKFVAIANSEIEGGRSLTEVDLADFATGLVEFENASASYCPCGKYLVQICCLGLSSATVPEACIMTCFLAT